MSIKSSLLSGLAIVALVAIVTLVVVKSKQKLEPECEYLFI